MPGGVDAAIREARRLFESGSAFGYDMCRRPGDEPPAVVESPAVQVEVVERAPRDGCGEIVTIQLTQASSRRTRGRPHFLVPQQFCGPGESSPRDSNYRCADCGRISLRVSGSRSPQPTCGSANPQCPSVDSFTPAALDSEMTQRTTSERDDIAIYGLPPRSDVGFCHEGVPYL